MSDNVKMVPALCTQCGGNVEVDLSKETAKCPYCGMEFIVEKAVNNYNVKYAHVEHADNVNIDVTGAVKEVLDFAGEQLKEGREDRRQREKEFAEQSRQSSAAFLKKMGIMFGGMFVFAIVAFLVMFFSGKMDGDESASSNDEGSTIECRLEDGCLYTDVLGKDVPEWRYLEFDSMGTVLQYESNDESGYHNSVIPEENVTDGVRYVVAGAYEDDFEIDEYTKPMYYSVIRVTIEGHDFTEASDPVIVDDLSEYDYN
jgi:predicted RNA-binding Zn-ribbon protein involved in translation (DUF1610 family)